MSYAIFHVIPENIEEPHISKQMQESSVQEHERKKREGLLAEAEVWPDFRNRVSGRYQSVYIDKLVQGLPLGKLDKKNQHVQADYKIIHNRVAFCLYGIPDRYHNVLK